MRNKYLILIFSCGLLVSYFAVYLGSRDFFSKTMFWMTGIEPLFEQSSTLENNLVPIKVLRHYQQCNHQTLENELLIERKNLIELYEQYPVNSGWTFKESEDLIVINRQEDGLCPVDRKKRHLKAVGKYVGIFDGPAGLSNQIQKMTRIKVESLPIDWQEKLKNVGLDFQNELEMLEALDSLDEFQ